MRWYILLRAFSNCQTFCDNADGIKIHGCDKWNGLSHLPQKFWWQQLLLNEQCFTSPHRLRHILFCHPTLDLHTFIFPLKKSTQVILTNFKLRQFIFCVSTCYFFDLSVLDNFTQFFNSSSYQSRCHYSVD